ncbi:MAG: hypothetical protein M1825_005022 [Sarcosagium campestre]|nr:MAG: hypothetical protein M1825_005022 [Sarcosagium campestre]
MFWASRKSPAEDQPTEVDHDEPSHPPAVPLPTRRDASTPSRLNPTRDEEADEEFKDFLRTVAADYAQAAESTSAAKSTSTEMQNMSAVPSSIAPDSLFPTTMSCREAFDSAFYCQSFGGQFNNLYRYGGVKQCSEHWSAFWFCMRTKSYPQPEREGKIQDFYRKREVKYKLGPSSEDVWRIRSEPVLGAFSEDPNALDEQPLNSE